LQSATLFFSFLLLLTLFLFFLGGFLRGQALSCFFELSLVFSLNEC
jgi:hypothetical protein